MRIHSHGYLDTGICTLIHSHYSRNPAIMEDDHSLYVLKAALLADNLFLQWQGGIQFIPSTRFLFGRQRVQSCVR